MAIYIKNDLNDNNNDLFFCYSIKLFRYLRDNGFRYESKFIHTETSKTCWTFKRTPAFEFAYEQFGINKATALGRQGRNTLYAK